MSFFKPDQTKSDKISSTPISCASCGLYKNCLSPRMKPYGKFRKKVLVIGEAPGEIEDRRNKPWQGRVGKDLQRTLKRLGFDLFKDGLSTNSCLCRPPKNKTPDPNQIACCRPKLVSIIKEHKPKMILLVGGTAINSLIGRSWKKKIGGITKWRGWTIPDQEHNAWICPVFHPSFVGRSEEKDGGNLARVIWEQDLKRALEKINEPIPKLHPEKYITYVECDGHFKSIFNDLENAQLLSFDYETTGLKPHFKGHQITNISACVSPFSCYSWENTPYTAKLWSKILMNPKILKSAHNLPFENMWSSHILKAKVKGWAWDSLINAHILDNRKGIGSLKFQTYVNFGFSDYDSHISPYLQSKTDKQGANSFNQILEYIKKYGIKDLLTYCGMDSIFGYHLTLKQMKEMGYTDADISKYTGC